MKAIAKRRFGLEGRKIAAGEVFTLPDAQFYDLAGVGLVEAVIDDAPKAPAVNARVRKTPPRKVAPKRK